MFSNNAAEFGGGAISSGNNSPSGNTLSVTNSTFSGNRSEGGGAILIEVGGSVVVNNSTFSNNSDLDGKGKGGAIDNENSSANAEDHPGGTDIIDNSTFSNNQALQGAAIFNTGPLNVNYSTFSGNSASIGGWHLQP
jgi:hypothetical protein